MEFVKLAMEKTALIVRRIAEEFSPEVCAADIAVVMGGRTRLVALPFVIAMDSNAQQLQ